MRSIKRHSSKKQGCQVSWQSKSMSIYGLDNDTEG